MLIYMSNFDLFYLRDSPETCFCRNGQCKGKVRDKCLIIKIIHFIQLKLITLFYT